MAEKHASDREHQTGNQPDPHALSVRLRCERDDSGSGERLREPGEHREVGMKPDTLNPANAERREAVVVLQASELALHCGAATVEALPFVRAVGDRAERDRASLPQADDRHRAALAYFVHDPVVVVALVGGDGQRSDAASVRGVEQRRDVERFVAAGCLHPPRDRQARPRADGGVNLVAVERSGSACRDSRALPPGGVRVGVPLALGAVVVDVPLTVRERGRSRQWQRPNRTRAGLLGAKPRYGRGSQPRRAGSRAA